MLGANHDLTYATDINISLLFKSRSTHQRPVSALTIMAKVVLARDYKTVGVFLLKLGFQGA